MRALVVEDEWAARNYLVELLQAAGGIELVGAVASTQDAAAVLAEEQVDVAFVDIQLGPDDGLELVRAHPTGPMFVLATAHSQHALAAYDLGVTDYLVKPFTAERVAQCLARVRARRPARESISIRGTPSAGGPQALAPLRIVGRRKRTLVFVRLDEVWAFEAADRLAYVHTARGVLDVDLSLAAIEASIGRTLVRVHRNWLVNADHVRELEGAGADTELLVGDVRVPVARERAAAVREKLLATAMGIRPR